MKAVASFYLSQCNFKCKVRYSLILGNAQEIYVTRKFINKSRRSHYPASSMPKNKIFSAAPTMLAPLGNTDLSKSTDSPFYPNRVFCLHLRLEQVITNLGILIRLLRSATCEGRAPLTFTPTHSSVSRISEVKTLLHLHTLALVNW